MSAASSTWGPRRVPSVHACSGSPAATSVAVRRFVIRLSFSNRYKEVKRVGTVLQVPSAELRRTAGKWTVLCIDVAKVMRAHLGPREHPPRILVVLHERHGAPLLHDEMRAAAEHAEHGRTRDDGAALAADLHILERGDQVGQHLCPARVRG